MSSQGKMLRGEKWYNFRDIDGNLPEDISKDENKMLDVSFYLENKKTTTPTTKKKVTQAKKESSE